MGMGQNKRRAALAFGLCAMMMVCSPAAFADDGDDCADGKGDAAIAACTRAIASGRSKGSDQAINFYNRGLDYYAKGDHAREIADFEAAIRMDPKMFDAYDDRGNVYYSERDYGRAVADYSVAIKLNPGDARAYYNRGIASKDQGDRERAFADFTSAIRLDPRHADAYFGRGLIYKNRGDTTHALADLKMAVRLNPDDSDAQAEVEALRAILRRH
jgi:tetratricopeptide (TPR) repeat protein